MKEIQIFLDKKLKIYFKKMQKWVINEGKFPQSF